MSHQYHNLKSQPARNFIIFLATISFCFNYAIADPIIVENASCKIPKRSVSIVENSININYKFSEFIKNTIPGHPDSLFYSLPGFGFCNEVGKPKVPMRVDSFIIPDGFKISLSYNVGNTISIPCKMVGAEYPLFDNGDSSVITHSQIQRFPGSFPIQSAVVLDEYTLRGERIAEVLVSPVKYNQQSGLAELAEDLSYTLTYTPIDESKYTDETDADYTSWTVYVNGHLNNALARVPKDIGKKIAIVPDELKGIIGYLIVTTDKYKDAVETFAYWKKRLGFTTQILSRPEWKAEGIKSADCVVKEAIWDYIDSHYNVKYLLIVGDNEDVPSHFSDFSFDTFYRPHFTDSYFSSKDDRSIFSDIYTGRISVNNIDEARTVLSKIARLEMCPIPDEQFYKSAYHFATFQTNNVDKSTEKRRFVQTSEEILNYMKIQGVDVERHYDLYFEDSTPQYYSSNRGSGLPLPEELTSGKFQWNYTSRDVQKSFNNPQFYTLYRSHGSKEGWRNFKIKDFDNIEQTQYPTTVFSIACLTGVFDDLSLNSESSPEESFAEVLLKLEDKGASAVFAASQNSYTWCNDCLIEGMIDAIWPNPGLIPNFSDITSNIAQTPEPTYRLGQILEQGLFRMNEQYGASLKEAVKYNYELFHLFGDPSMDFFTKAPTTTASGSYHVSGDKITAGTNDKYSVVGLYNPITGDCRRFEGKIASFYADYPTEYIITTSGHNYLPYIQEHVTPLSDKSDHSPQIIACRVNEDNTASVSVSPKYCSGELEIAIYDIYGNVVACTKIDNKLNMNDINVHLQERNGLYIVILREDSIVKDSKKIIKAHK